MLGGFSEDTFPVLPSLRRPAASFWAMALGLKQEQDLAWIRFSGGPSGRPLWPRMLGVEQVWVLRWLTTQSPLRGSASRSLPPALSCLQARRTEQSLVWARQSRGGSAFVIPAAPVRVLYLLDLSQGQG